jgi:hypothetical protein
MFTLDYLHSVVLEDVPLQWMTRIELFSNDLEQFPLMYVHFLANKETPYVLGNYNPDEKQRIFGFVLNAQWSDVKNNGLCNVSLSFACNIPQSFSEEYDNTIRNELSHRIGMADKVSFDDLTTICSNSPEALPLLEKIWRDKLEVIYGDFLPHGRLFEEVYGIVRFSASGNAPKLGKVSEYRMLYWYMQDLGEKVSFRNEVAKYSFLEAYVLPTYNELRGERFNDFVRFSEFYLATKRFWEIEYSEMFTANGVEFRYAPRDALPQNSIDFEARYPALLGSDYDKISRLRQLFNRMPSRLYGYVWNIMTAVSVDYKTVFANRETFKEFYRDHSGKKGLSTKVVACFLQQVLGVEAFPIDTWVKSFIHYPLGLDDTRTAAGDPTKTTQNILYSRYSRLDKLEKIIWASSMGNKTNKKEFMDILWCQRYGTDKGGSGSYRGANPLSCNSCVLRNECLSFQRIRNQNIYVSDSESKILQKMIEDSLIFGIKSENKTPRKVFTKKNNQLVARDFHSGLDLSSAKQIDEGIYSVEDFINQLNL